METTEAERFAAEFGRVYDEKTVLGSFCDRRGYSEDTDDDFFQIGRRASVPTGFVDEGRYRYVSEGVVGALCEGEKRFVVDRLTALADEGVVPTVEGARSPTEAARDAVEEPTAVLVPRNTEGDAAVEGWDDDGYLRRLGNRAYIETGTDGDGTDVWLYRHDGDGIFVVNAERVGVVQKEVGETRAPGWTEYGNDEGRLGVYLGEPEDGFVQVAYRVVVSAPVVEKGGVCRVRL